MSLCASAAETGVPLSEIGGLEAAQEVSVYDEIPEGHWVYRAVGRLADRGLLDNYGGFAPDQPLTTYELAVIVGDMVDTYNSVTETGLTPSALRPDAPEYAPPVEEPEGEASPALPSTITLAQVLDTPALETVTRPPRVQKKKTPETQEEPSKPGEAWLEFSDEAREAQPAPVVVKLKRASGPALIEEEKKEEKKKEEKPKEEKKTEKEKPKEKLPKELKDLEKKKLDLTDKDIIILQELVDYVKGEFKKSDADIKKLKADIKKDIQGVKKATGKNTSDIENLKQENQRFKVTGSGTVTIKSYGKVNKEDTSVSISNSTSFDVYSRPRKFQDMVLRTNLSGSKADIRYSNFERGNRNFMARSLNFGPVSPSYSFLTVFGKDITGHTGEFLLNDYTVKYHYGTPGSNTYTYGASLQSTILGEPASLAYLSRIFIYEDKSKVNQYREAYGNYWRNCELGSWYDANPYDNNDNSDSYALCKPPYKNSVTSLFIRYPIADRITLSTEFAHSTFFRKGFNSMYGEYCTSRDSNGYCTNYGTNFNINSKYLSDKSSWRTIPELRDQDDAYFIFLDFTKDNLSVFPIGYAHLGSKFASKYFGLPGMSLDDFGVDVLPINLQSLEAFVVSGNLDKKRQNYKWDFTAAHIRETQPMFLDLSAMPKDIQWLAPIDRFSNRTNEGLLSFRIFQNKLTYYLSNRMTFSYDYMYGKGGLGPDCLDGNFLEIKNDKGEVIDKVIGDGVRNCAGDANDMPLLIRVGLKNQTYNFWMRTSKRGEYSLDFKSEELLLKIDLGENAKAARDALVGSLPYGTTYSFNNKLTYRLTDVSSLEFWYNYKFGRPSKARVKDDTYQDLGLTVSMSF